MFFFSGYQVVKMMSYDIWWYMNIDIILDLLALKFYYQSRILCQVLCASVAQWSSAASKWCPLHRDNCGSVGASMELKSGDMPGTVAKRVVALVSLCWGGAFGWWGEKKINESLETMTLHSTKWNTLASWSSCTWTWHCWFGCGKNVLPKSWVLESPGLYF